MTHRATEGRCADAGSRMQVRGCRVTAEGRPVRAALRSPLVKPVMTGYAMSRLTPDIARIASDIRSTTICRSLPTPSSTRTDSRSIFAPSTSATLSMASACACRAAHLVELSGERLAVRPHEPGDLGHPLVDVAEHPILECRL